MNTVRTTLFSTLFAVILILFTVGFINMLIQNPTTIASLPVYPDATTYPQSVLESANIAGIPETTTPQTVVLGESENALTPEEVLNDPDQLLYQNITVLGTLDTVMDNRTFVLNTEGETALLILTQQPYLDEKQSVFFTDNDEVAVTGTLIPFEQSLIEPEYDLRILQSIYDEYPEAYAIIVESVGKRVEYSPEPSAETPPADSQEESI